MKAQWPCPTCGARDFAEAGNQCRAEVPCSADDQREEEYERKRSTLNSQPSTPNRDQEAAIQELDGPTEARLAAAFAWLVFWGVALMAWIEHECAMLRRHWLGSKKP